jgi:hypothetical protein
MPYISTIERLGEARGESSGESRGKLDLLSLLLAQQVGTIFTETVEELRKLPTAQLDQLALDLRGLQRSTT